MCFSCFTVPSTDDRISFKWTFTPPPGIKLSGTVFKTHYFKQIGNGVTFLDGDSNNELMWVDTKQPNNGAFISKHLLRRYLKSRSELVMLAVLCDHCTHYSEFLWKKRLHCHNDKCRRRIEIPSYPVLCAKMRFAEYRLRFTCKRCLYSRDAREFNFLDKRECPKCNFKYRTNDVVTFKREFPKEEGNEDCCYFTHWGSDRCNYIVTQIDVSQVTQSTSQQLSSSTRSTSQARPSTSTSVPSPSIVPKASTSTYTPQCEDDDDDDDEFQDWGCGVKPRFYSGPKSKATSSFDWEDNIERVVALDVEIFHQPRGPGEGKSVPRPIIVSLYGQSEKGGQPRHLIKNQFIEVQALLPLEFSRLVLNGITQEHFQGARDKLTFQQVKEKFQEHFKNSLVIHHGKNDLISLDLKHEKMEEEEKKYNCRFLDTTTVLVDKKSEAISIGRLTQAVFGRKQPEPHTPDQDAKMLYDLFQELVVKYIRKNNSSILPRPIFSGEIPPAITRKNKVFKLHINCLCHLRARCKCSCKYIYGNFINNCNCCCECNNSQFKNRDMGPSEFYRSLRDMSR